MTKIKICGLTRPEDIDAVNRYRPDYIGFVFAESKRRVTPTQAAALKRQLTADIKAVGVFVNAGLDDIVTLCHDGVIDAVQLHGDEGADYMLNLKEKINVPVVKALRVQSREQIQKAEALPCDFLLLDAYRENVYGGTGERFDISLIPPLQKPFFLAGGLNADNIKKAAASHPYCLDLSSGVETNGVKDDVKIRDIIRIIREEC
ncbi:phosphoribosylanthranilate isomerase [Oscillospiraceae bacterium CM]|nr:phosphoribosylanthranilate isomerase [Oscillospiraceae bacterium CM]